MLETDLSVQQSRCWLRHLSCRGVGQRSRRRPRLASEYRSSSLSHHVPENGPYLSDARCASHRYVRALKRNSVERPPPRPRTHHCRSTPQPRRLLWPRPVVQRCRAEMIQPAATVNCRCPLYRGGGSGGSDLECAAMTVLWQQVGSGSDAIRCQSVNRSPTCAHAFNESGLQQPLSNSVEGSSPNPVRAALPVAVPGLLAWTASKVLERSPIDGFELADSGL